MIRKSGMAMVASPSLEVVGLLVVAGGEMGRFIMSVKIEL
jgi:hypothetical protein